MVKVRVASTFVVLVVAAVIGAGAASFERGPYSGAPGNDGVTISWVSAPTVPARIEYEVRAEYEITGAMTLSVPVPPLGEDPAVTTTHAKLSGLLPSTDYVYRVVLTEEEAETASPVGAFSTAPLPGEDVSFAVLADTQLQSEGTNRLKLVGDAIAKDETPFDFILHAGDLVESPIGDYWPHWFASFEAMLLRAPFLPVLGNHERNHRTYYEAFVLPPGGGRDDEQWWALHWGDVVVVGLDTNVSRVADYYAQQDWAREHLSGPEPHKFVIFHHPVFSSDALHGSGYSYDVIYHPIFLECGVDVVFNGHAHNYERLERDGIVYLVLGGGGATPRALAEEHVPESIRAIDGNYFYARVEIVDGVIDVDVISVGREPVDGGRLTVRTRRLDAFTPGVPETATFRSHWIWLAVAAIGGLAALVVSRLVSD
jgi:predicted phosphodiesterase